MLDRQLMPGVRLRLPEERDCSELAALIAANRDYLARWLSWAAGSGTSETQSFIRSARRQVADNDGIQTVIEVDGALSGCVGLHRIDWANQTTSVGYWLAEARQGSGIMTAAVRAYTDYSLIECGLNRIVIQAAVENAPSRRVAERLGYRQEGVLREVEKVGERRLDHALYAMLAAEWREGLADA